MRCIIQKGRFFYISQAIRRVQRSFRSRNRVEPEGAQQAEQKMQSRDQQLIEQLMVSNREDQERKSETKRCKDKEDWQRSIGQQLTRLELPTLANPGEKKGASEIQAIQQTRYQFPPQIQNERSKYQHQVRNPTGQLRPEERENVSFEQQCTHPREELDGRGTNVKRKENLNHPEESDIDKATLRKQLRDESAQFRKLEEDFRKMKKRLEMVQEQRDESKKIEISLRKESDQAHKKLKVKTERIRHLESQLYKKQREVEDGQKQMDHLQKRFTRRAAASARFTEELQKMPVGQMKQQLTEMEKRIQVYQSETENLREKFRTQEQSYKDLQGQLNTKDQQLKQCQARLTVRRQKLQEKQKKTNSLEKELQARKERERDLQNQVNIKDQQLQQGRSQFVELKNQSEINQTSLEEEIRNLQIQSSAKDQQVNELHEKLQASQINITSLEEELKTLKQSISYLRSHQNAKDHELQQKFVQLTELQGRLQQNETQTVTLQQRLRDREQEITELRTRTLNQTERERSFRHSNETDMLPWQIKRNEIQMTDNPDNSLGVGAWARVVRGKFRRTKVAVKEIHQVLLSDENSYIRESFEVEVGIASRCRHPCLLQFIGASIDAEGLLLITELMDRSLRSLYEEQPLLKREVCIISLDVVLALNYLHKSLPHPIIHRDISSANVLLWRQNDQWRAKVSDYGNANYVRQSRKDGPGSAVYSAPEAMDDATKQNISCKVS